MGYNVYLASQRAKAKMLREYFSGMPLKDLSKRYGYSEKKIISLASEYKQGKIDIFDDRDKRKLAMSMMSHEEEVRLLRDKIAALETLCRLFGFTRQGLWEQGKSHFVEEIDNTAIISEVKMIRRDMPRLGVRKLQVILGDGGHDVGLRQSRPKTMEKLLEH